MRQPITIVTIAAVLVLGACARDENASSNVTFSSATPPSSPGSAPDLAPSAAPSTTVSSTNAARSVSGSDAVAIEISTEPRIELVTDGVRQTLLSELRDSGKRKYYDETRTQVAEVKFSESGFKVRTADGKLLWKVKISDEKIRVSDNEENLSPWVLKTGYPDKAKILDPSETELGEVRFARGSGPGRIRGTAGEELWTVDGSERPASWGVLLIDRIPRVHQTIIIAELLARGR